MRTKPVDPKANGFAADDDAALRKQVLDIRGAERKAMVGPVRMGDDLARKTKAPSGAALTAVFSCLNCYPSQKWQTTWQCPL